MSHDSVYPHTFDTTYAGLNLRDYFAAQALSAIYKFAAEQPGASSDDRSMANVAQSCYALADAMLVERAKS